MIFPRRVRLLIVCVTLAGSLLALSAIAQAPPAAAPSAPEIPADYPYAVAKIPEPALLNPKSKDYLELARAKSRVLTGQVAFSEGKADFDRWYGHFFRALTLPDQAEHLPDRRKELVKDLQTVFSRSPEVHKQLSDMTLSFCRNLANPARNFHPAVRYNAMLIIGELNRKEPTATQSVPDPLPAGLAVLLEELKNPAQIDAVRLAALIGIQRHVQLDLARPAADKMSREEKSEIYQQMLGMLTMDHPAGRSKEGHEWMQRRAIETLVQMGILDDSNAAFAAVEGFLDDPKRGMALRIAAAKALKSIDAKSRATINPTMLAYRLSVLAGDACRAELTQLEKLSKKQASAMDSYGSMMGYGAGGDAGMGMGMAPGMGPGMGMGMGMGPGMGMGMGMDGSAQADPRVIPTQRRLLTELFAVQDGLKGLATVAKADVTNDLAALEKAVETTIKLVQGPPPAEKPRTPGMVGAMGPGAPVSPAAAKGQLPLTVESLTKDLKKRTDEIEKITQRLAPPSAKPPADPDDLEIPGVPAPAPTTPAPAPEKAAAVPSTRQSR